MEVTVVRSGPLTTVQDRGRRGYRAAGVPLSGALDPFALRVANLLVGNPETAAGLEFNLVGPELAFSTDALVALGGAECEGLPRWKPQMIAAGTRLAVGPCAHGARGYLCVAGGIAVPEVLGSRSTYVPGGFGGFSGRPLRNGDVLHIAGGAETIDRLARGPSTGPSWQIDPRILPAYSPAPVIRVVRGPQAEQFGEAFYAAAFRISPRSDRMGFRLEGERLARAPGAGELLSAAVAPGVIQVPPDGAPVVLMADAQTLGGYPQIAHVIAVDIPVMAQLRPGDTVRFAEITLHEAHRLASAREWALAMLREGLAAKLRSSNAR